MPPLPNSQVNQQQAQMLYIGNRVIAEVKQIIPFGAGNQIQDLQRTGNKSFYRTYNAYDSYDKQVKVDTDYINEPRAKPRLMAAIANRYDAGNCDMAGAIAYSLLRGILDNGYEVMYIQSSHHKHSYAAFKENMADDNEAFIVDPWPISAMATLPEHHICGFNGVFPNEIKRKPGKLAHNVAAADRIKLVKDILPYNKYRALDEYINQQLSVVEQFENANLSLTPSGTMWDENLSSKVVGRYVYESEDTGTEYLVPLPVELLIPTPTNLLP